MVALTGTPTLLDFYPRCVYGRTPCCSGDFDGHQLHLGSKRCRPHSPGSSLSFSPRQLRLFVNLGINNPAGADPHLPAPLCLARESHLQSCCTYTGGFRSGICPGGCPQSKQPLPLLREAFSAGSDAVEHETTKLERLAESSPLRSATGHILVRGDSRTTLPHHQKEKRHFPLNFRRLSLPLIF